MWQGKWFRMEQEQRAANPARIFLAAGVFGMALGGLVPGASPSGAAWAQEDVHDHEEGGGKGGTGGHGGGGHNGGGHPAPPGALPVAQPGGDRDGAVAPAGASGAANYIRLELGAARGSAGDAHWLPKGYPEDPQVFFDVDVDSGAMAAFAVGRDYGTGWRGEVALNVFGKTDFAGPWSHTIPDTDGPHADVEGSIHSFALMANGSRDFDNGGAVTPFVTFGLGMAHNTMGDWTRISPEGDRRTFESHGETGLAWSVGAGVSWDVGPVLGLAPAKLDLTWRYFDLGSVSGSTQRVDSGGGTPDEALNFDVTDHVIGLGLRIPL